MHKFIFVIAYVLWCHKKTMLDFPSEGKTFLN